MRLYVLLAALLPLMPRAALADEEDNDTDVEEAETPATPAITHRPVPADAHDDHDHEHDGLSAEGEVIVQTGLAAPIATLPNGSTALNGVKPFTLGLGGGVGLRSSRWILLHVDLEFSTWAFQDFSFGVHVGAGIEQPLTSWLSWKLIVAPLGYHYGYHATNVAGARLSRPIHDHAYSFTVETGLLWRGWKRHVHIFFPRAHVSIIASPIHRHVEGSIGGGVHF